MAKFHVNTKTGKSAQCRANQKPCPLGGDSGVENHYATREEAEAVGQAILAERHNPLKSVRRRNPRISDAVPTADPSLVKRKGRKMTEQEALLRDSVRELTEKLVEVRAEVGDVAFEDADPVRAKRRLNEAIEFADSRGNTHLMKKLTGADVLPSGAFRLADGRRANTDRFIDSKTMLQHVDDNRKIAEATLNALVQRGHVPTGSYKTKNNAASVTVTVKDGALDQDEFDKLPEDVRKAISSPKEKIDINLVRQNISIEKQDTVISSTQVVDKIIGKPHDLGQDKVKFGLLGGGTDVERFQSGVDNIGTLYRDAREVFGSSQKAIKAESDQMADAMKAISASRNPGRNTFVPARSQMNGAVVTGRENISRVKAKEIFTPAELKSVTVIESVPDIEKARKVLPSDVFEKIFNARKVSVRVTEAA